MNKTYCDQCNVERIRSGSEYVAPYTWLIIILKDNIRDSRPETTKEFCSIECCNEFFNTIKDELSITRTREYYKEQGTYYQNKEKTQ